MATRRLTLRRLPMAPRFSTYTARLGPSPVLRSAATTTSTHDGNAFAELARPLMVTKLDTFPHRHIGPDDSEAVEMLNVLSPPAQSFDEFISQVIPANILSTSRELLTKNNQSKSHSLDERDVAREANELAESNEIYTNFIGAGYSPTVTPGVIARNIFQNPAWYTSYTPYQAEISQGRLESLLNYQTLVSDLTSLPVANASLLDEGTAAAEAMTMSLHTLPTSRQKRSGKTFVISDRVHPQTLSVIKSRAEGFKLDLKVIDVSSPAALETIKGLGQDLVGVLVQYPDTRGHVHDFRKLADAVHEQGALLSAATDLLALTTLTPPGEWGADIALGSAQRLGIPLGYGGPHAAFFSVKESLKRKIPGRLVGISKDRRGNNALRLALQTREQHIRREKATSNVCTAQALLANMSAMYAIYHGPSGLKAQAEKLTTWARLVQVVSEFYGIETEKSPLNPDGRVLFDTVVLKTGERAQEILERARQARINLRDYGNGDLGISVHEQLTPNDLGILLGKVIKESATKNQSVSYEEAFEKAVQEVSGSNSVDFPSIVKRTSKYLTHPVFNTHHSETELLRYIHHLQSKDLSLVHSMIPLGSCTMKLNGTTEMEIITLPGFSNQHPYSPAEQNRGYQRLIDELEEQLAAITGMDGTSIQPNSGAQGEFAGLRVIRKYHEKQPGAKRDICLIPVSAHGTNPASATMAGMRVVPIKCNTDTGNLDLADLEAKCKKHADELGAIMITYPSTFGVFEPEVKKVCEIVHQYGGLVYMDGANMNAQIGLSSPGEIGADVCHLNLHKTFCIPHGGGGPGVGPICVKKDLIPFLPGESPKAAQPMVSSAPYGSASILPISWAYNKLMGTDGLRKATQVTLLNANYLLARLKSHYKILYTNEHGRCAHEFILDARPFKETAGIEAIDIAKRLQDYGFHAPTMSWPVANTLMIEPTESESKEELDRFVDALVAIRQEIRDIEEGRMPREGNVLKMSPHPIADIVEGDGEGKWDRPYTREQAAYPLPWLKEKKFWPSVARVDDAYGDLNLFCTCPPVEDTTNE
ncbi:hypothetical protein jhhlp_004213 [Lomentospora prolificans]|uniref:Glycine cleavage system P protein n=1 Tax=Lomentospora prolificans TaxID=41688 RepID=A0A2N3NAW1_9PEZI|nr:hypothetical protein jhhlp_004213 [Lomentospora prolificans]